MSFAKVSELLVEIVASIAPAAAETPEESSNVERSNNEMRLERELALTIERAVASEAALAAAQNRILQALQLMMFWGNIEGESEKRWVIVETIKKLIGSNEATYEALVMTARGDLIVNEDGEFDHPYEWDEGIAPDDGDFTGDDG